MRLRCVGAALIVLGLAGGAIRPAGASPQIRAVIIEIRNGEVMINRGAVHGVRTGLLLEAYRQGERVGLLRIVTVEEIVAWAAILEDGGVALGCEAVSADETTPAPEGAGPGPQAGAEAEPGLQATVSQVTGGWAYIDRGTVHGVGPGMIFRVTREGSEVGRLQIVEVEETEARARILEDAGMGVGDVAVATGETAELPPTPEQPSSSQVEEAPAQPPAVGPAPVRALVRLIADGQVEINRGSNHGVETDMVFTIERDGQPVGEVRVIQVDEISARAEIRWDEGLVVGDQAVSVRQVTPPPPVPEPLPELPAAEPTRRKPEAESGWYRPRPDWGYHMLEIISPEELAYDWLRTLAAQGHLPGYSARDFAGENQRLWTAKEIGYLTAEALRAYLGSERGWDRLSRYALIRLLLRFENETVMAGIPAGVPLEVISLDLIQGSDELTVPTTTLFASGTLQAGGGFASADADQWGVWGRGKVSLGVGPGFDAFVDAQLSDQDTVLRLYDRRLIEQAGLSAMLNPNQRIYLGQLLQRWGSGYYGTMMVSENAPAIPLIGFHTNVKMFGIPFEFEQFHGTFIEDSERRYTVGRRFSLLLGNRLEASIAEAALMRDTGHLLLSFFVAPLFLMQLIDEPDDGDTNFLGSIDLAYHINDRSSAYFQLLVDDVTTKDPPVPRKLGFLGGLHWKDKPIRERWDLRIEFSDIDPNVYGHRDPLSAWEIEERSMGHHIGGDAEDLFVKVRYSPSSRDDLSLVANFLRKGNEQQTRPMYDEYLSFGYHHDLTPEAFVGLRLMDRRIRHQGFVPNVDLDETRLWLELGYGF